MVLCRVRGCKYSNTHVTIAHKCGTCGLFGHGKIECSNPEAIKVLGNYYLEKIPKDKKCKIGGCKYKDRHTTEGHICNYCDKIGIKNHSQKCPKSGTKIVDDNVQFNHVINDNVIQDGYYVIISSGMDNNWYIRNNKGIIEYFFMDFECWGQHGEETSDVPRLRAFTENYEYQIII